MENKRYITAEEAISLLPSGDTIHTFVDGGIALIGADWEREDVLQKLVESDKIEITGEMARSMGHGLAVYSDTAKYMADILFIETDKGKLDAFDPIEEPKKDPLNKGLPLA